MKSSAKDSKEAGSDSFGKELEVKLGRAKELELGKNPGSKFRMDQPMSSQQKSRLDEPKERRESEKARPPEKAEARAEAKPGEKAKTKEDEKKSVKATDREKAIKKFMDSFESEFEIPSTRLVEAIANLDESDLAKTPEETADAVIAELGLDEADADRARAMYAALLVDLSKAQPLAAPASDMIANSQAANFAEGIRQRAFDATEKRSLMNAGIDRMNQSFWAKPGAQDQAMGSMANAMAPQSQALSRMMVGEDLEGIDTQQVSDEMMKAGGPQSASDRIELPPHLRGQLEANLTPALAAALAAKQAQMQAAANGSSSEASADGESAEGEESVSSVAGGKPSYESSGLNKAEAGVGSGLGALAGALANPSDSESAYSNSNQQNSQDDFAKAMTHQKGHLKADSKLADKEDFKAALGADALNAQALPAKTELHAGATATAVAGANLTPGTAEHDANIRQLMGQAQYLVKRGGGEVKVEMTPEGMGPVQLRVMVKDGKVQVQMNAETAEAKKVIESSLAELKTSLAAHKLSVDHIKVDVVNGTNTDTATNNQQNLNQGGMQRDSTQRFWNQFNDNFGSPQQQRENFSDITDLKGYTQKRDPLQALESSSVRNLSSEGRGRGVNVVA